MKQQLYMIPVMDALRAKDECPFCLIEKELEEHSLDFVLGSQSSYMESDVREQTDETGFCREHFKMMFQYGNHLGSSMILETHLKKLSAELKNEMEHDSGAVKKGLFSHFHKDASVQEEGSRVGRWIRKKEKTCYICDHIKSNYKLYVSTFFELCRRAEPEFTELLKTGKGFCIHHFADVMDGAEKYLKEDEQKALKEIIIPQMNENLNRVIGDLEWFQVKYDYRFRDADWKDSKDAVQRGMQKIAGGYPAKPPYQQK